MAEIGGAGEKQLQAVLTKLTQKIDKPRFIFEIGACFIAGTQVHTKEGLVPIEKLKVGDWVLSKPENGGERAYKRVVNTFVHHDKEVMQISFRLKGSQPWDDQPLLTSTFDHPYWVEGKGWTAAIGLSDWRSSDEQSQLQLADGSNVEVATKTLIYATDKPGIGWVNYNGKYQENPLWDYNKNELASEEDEPYDWEEWDWNREGKKAGEDVYFRTTVYNIEVEDFHTYYVGPYGVWVHNANC